MAAFSKFNGWFENKKGTGALEAKFQLTHETWLVNGATETEWGYSKEFLESALAKPELWTVESRALIEEALKEHPSNG